MIKIHTMGYKNNYTSFLYKVNNEEYKLLKRIDLKEPTVNQAFLKACKIFKVKTNNI